MRYFVTALTIVIAADLTSKAIADGQLASFGLGTASIFFTLILFGLVAVLARKAFQCTWFAISYGLLIGGALSNFLEFLIRGQVEDFIRIGSVVTNVADLAEMLGCAGMVVSILIYRRRIVRHESCHPTVSNSP
jgi:lipoprotein signal peptidase